jgi:hypothetical protein
MARDDNDQIPPSELTVPYMLSVCRSGDYDLQISVDACYAGIEDGVEMISCTICYLPGSVLEADEQKDGLPSCLSQDRELAANATCAGMGGST